MHEIEQIIVNNKEYYLVDDLQKVDPSYFIGCSRIRQIIDRKEIKEENYLFIKGTVGNYSECSSKYSRGKLVLLKSWADETIPKLSNNKTSYKYEEAPPILELNDNEKFRDVDNNALDIRVRGYKDVDKCYFNLTDISKGFNINNLKTTIRHVDRGYIINIHYKTFIVNTMLNEHTTNSKNTVKYHTYLTYTGVLKVLFSSRTKNAEKFTQWASKTLFTIQMGTTEEKTKLVNNILGTDALIAKSLIGSISKTVSSVYLLSLGYVKDLRHSLNIKDNADNYMLCKFGRTNDLERRLSEHIRTFNKTDGVDLRLMMFAIIEDEYGSEAETDIKGFFDFAHCRLEHEKYDELVIIDKSKIKHIKARYESLQREYGKGLIELKKYIEQLEKEKEELDGKLKLKEQDLIHKNIELKYKDIEIDHKKIEVENIKRELLQKEKMHEKDLENERLRRHILELSFEKSDNALKLTKEDVDKYYLFLNECTEESHTHISNIDLFNSFKIWFKNKYSTKILPNNRDFLNGIRKHKNIYRSVKINKKITSGVKFLKLKNDNNNIVE